MQSGLFVTRNWIDIMEVTVHKFDKYSRGLTTSKALASFVAAIGLLAVAIPDAHAQSSTVTKPKPTAAKPEVKKTAPSTQAPANFPPELVRWKPYPANPIFEADAEGHWDVKIRERGWILPNGDGWRLWYTGYDGSRDGIKMLGYATSNDGIHWTPSPKNPIYRERWVEDMCVVKHGDTYYMFAESEDDNHAQMLTSANGTDWKWIGKLDVRTAADKTKATRRPCGTPTVWIEGNTWYLMYEWMDKGVWLATTQDPMSLVWQDVQDEAVLSPGPDSYDKEMIAVNQVFRYQSAYYAVYHGSGSGDAVPRTWTTNIARSTDRVHWQKYSANPIVEGNRSSGVIIRMPSGFRLYTMHSQIDMFEAKR